VNPFIWKCVDDGDQQGCGVLGKRRPDMEKHRQSKTHANGIALGAPDMSKGIRADGWHCVDDGDKPGFCAVVSMDNSGWCSNAHLHLIGAGHANRVAEWRRVDAEQNTADNAVSFAQRRRAYFANLEANANAVKNDKESDPFVHPYIWKCVNDGDQQGCGLLGKTRPDMEKHRQLQIHANGIALGAPDMSKGIRADGWHCLDDGDKSGCGAVLSMKSDGWCSQAHQHLMSLTHAKSVAALRRKPSRKRRRASVDVKLEADALPLPALAVVAAADDESDDDADDA
jgi:hypothetical protein